MNRTIKIALVCAVMVCVILTVPAFASPVTGGNPAYLVPGQTDTWSNATFVDYGSPISGTGTITSWTIYAGATGPLELLIYSGSISGGIPSLTLVGSDPVSVNSTGINTFSVSIPVQSGDYIGWYTPDAGVISFQNNVGPTIYAWDNTTPSLLAAGSPGAGFTGDREYAITVPEPSMALLLIPALGFVGVIRKKFMA